MLLMALLCEDCTALVPVESLLTTTALAVMAGLIGTYLVRSLDKAFTD